MHVAIIMDGNGRWAASRGLPRPAGHKAGGDAVRRTIRAARAGGAISYLTLYAFSSDNWKRPETEVGALMRLFETMLARETAECAKNGIRLRVIGRRDRLSERLVRAIEKTEAATAQCEALEVRIAIDYSSRDRILEAARQGASTREAFDAALDTPDVDLVIRTSGEQRLSDFLLWEAAYAELWFTPVLWPDFGAADLDRAIAEFRARTRRYGAVA